MPAPELPLLTFADAPAVDAWLAEQPEDSAGAWLRFAKAGAPEHTVSKSDAIDCALAHGWIDGQLGTVDAAYFKTRFTPRKAKSRWSQVNVERCERLIAQGRMTPRGQAQIGAAKADGRWVEAYAPASRITAPDDLQAALDADAPAAAAFAALSGANRYAVLYRAHHLKPGAGRAAKIAALVAQLARGETIHPQPASKPA